MTGTWAVAEKLTVPGVLGVPVVVLGAGVAETFKQVLILLGRQLVHGFPAFTQAQPLHEPVLLHLQQATISQYGKYYNQYSYVLRTTFYYAPRSTYYYVLRTTYYYALRTTYYYVLGTTFY